MSRSYRKTPIADVISCGSDSDRPWKKIWHRKMRARLRAVLHDFDVETLVMPVDREASDVWESRKEYRHWFDPREHPRMMRK